MKLIDADALESAFIVLIYEFVHRAPNWSPNDMLTSGRDTALKYEYKADGVEAALNIVRRMPTIDAKPVKHGAWIEKKPSRAGIVVDLDEAPNKWRIEEHIGLQILHCTKCNGTINANTYAEYYQHHFKFCPFCGEEMRGGKQCD